MASWKRGLLILFSVFGIALLGLLFFFGTAGLKLGRSISLENENASFFSQWKSLAGTMLSDKRPKLKGEDEGRVNILLLGRAGEHYPGKNLTDTVMIVSIDTDAKKVALLSLPRDLYAPIPDIGLYTKINSMYQYGLNQGEGTAPLQSAVENITGQPIHYFLTLDFDGFEKAVDSLGGIQVDVPRDFYDPRYPGKNYSYETFELKKGWQTLDGPTALKYVRERHNDPEGDFGRAKRQQQVLQAIKDKALSPGTLFNLFTLHSLIETLGESVKTDMKANDIESLLELSKTLDTKNVATVVIDAWKKESLLRVTHIEVGPVRAFALVPRVGNWSEIREVSEHIFGLDVLKKRQAEIATEEPTAVILATSADFALAEKMSTFIEDELRFESVTVLPLPALENRPEKSMITDRTGLKKPYSFDELLKKFPLEKTANLSATLPPKNTSDFVIVFGEDLVDTLSLDEAETAVADLEQEAAAFSEVLPPQPKAKKKKE